MDKEAALTLVSAAAAMDIRGRRAAFEGDFEISLRKAVGDLMGYVARDIILPSVDRYPNLDPDKKAGS